MSVTEAAIATPAQLTNDIVIASIQKIPPTTGMAACIIPFPLNEVGIMGLVPLITLWERTDRGCLEGGSGVTESLNIVGRREGGNSSVIPNKSGAMRPVRSGGRGGRGASQKGWSKERWGTEEAGQGKENRREPPATRIG